MKQWRMGAVTFAVLLMTFLAGCGGGREAALTGSWKVSPSSMPQMPAGIANMAKMMVDISLDLRADKTFVFNMGRPLGTTMEGTWAFDDASNRVALNVTKIDGKAMPAPAGGANPWAMTFKLDETNKKLMMPHPGAATGRPGMVLEKQG